MHRHSGPVVVPAVDADSLRWGGVTPAKAGVQRESRCPAALPAPIMPGLGGKCTVIPVQAGIQQADENPPDDVILRNPDSLHRDSEEDYKKYLGKYTRKLCGPLPSLSLDGNTRSPVVGRFGARARWIIAGIGKLTALPRINPACLRSLPAASNAGISGDWQYVADTQGAPPLAGSDEAPSFLRK